MKIAEDFRRIAREALSGKWPLAVGAGIVASILGAIGEDVVELKINIDGSNSNLALSLAGHEFLSSNAEVNPGIGAFIAGGIGIIAIAAILVAVVYFVLGSIIGVGYAKFNLNLTDGKAAAVENLFGYFSQWKTTAAARILRSLYTLLWTLLFIVPGIMASYSYIMTDYILAEKPHLTASEAIEESKSIMMGNRFRLFCLQFSFIGWDILAALTFGIGYLWLTPYKQAAYAAFYREISQTEFYEFEKEN